MNKNCHYPNQIRKAETKEFQLGVILQICRVGGAWCCSQIY